jgi:hypothetical protein
MYTAHHYTGGSAAPNQVPQFAEKIHSHGKAFVEGEYTWTDKDYNGAATFTIDSMLKNIEGCQFVDGDGFWELLAPLTNFGGGFVCHYPGDNSDMITRVGKLSTHAGLLPTLTKTSAAIGSGWSFLNDTFTAPDGTLQQNHTADSGASWIKELDYSADGTVQSNRMWYGSQTYYTAAVYPPSPDYDVTGSVRIVSNATDATVVVRGRTGEGVASGYLLILYCNGSAYNLTIRRWAWDGSTFDIGSAPLPVQPAVGSDHTMTLRMKGSQLSAYWDGTLVIGPTTNTDITVTGLAGCGGLNNTSTTGIHLKSITAAANAQLITPVASAVLEPVTAGLGVLPMVEKATASIPQPTCVWIEPAQVGNAAAQMLNPSITLTEIAPVEVAAASMPTPAVNIISSGAPAYWFAVDSTQEAALQKNHSGSWFAWVEAMKG